MPSTQLHATCVSINGKGVLLLGPSSSGKSDLGLRLVDGGAQLVADDRVDIKYFPSSLEGEGGVGGKQQTSFVQVTPPPSPLPQGEGNYAFSKLNNPPLASPVNGSGQ